MDAKTPEYVTVNDLPDSLKECYLSVLVWLVHRDDAQIDERELCEIQVLMTQVECNVDVRQSVRAHLEVPESLDVEAQVARMLELVPSRIPETASALRCSLMKDAIRVRRATSEGFARGKPAIRQLAAMLELNEKQVAFIEDDVCVKDEEILAGDVSDKQITNAAKEMAAQATAVGVPVAAVYLSGSVTGLSAAGIVLGTRDPRIGGACWACPPWSPESRCGDRGRRGRVQGSALGPGRVVSGGKTSRRELMLQEVLRIHQGAIINLAEDISFFGQRVEALTGEMESNRDAIDRLSREVALMSRSASALNRLRDRASGFERDWRAEAVRQAAR